MDAKKNVPYDDKAKAAAKDLQQILAGVRNEIIVHTQFRRNVASSPSDPNWGQPNPIDINGLIESAFAEGIKYANARFNEGP